MKEMDTHFSILAWRTPWTGSLVGNSLWGRKELGMTERLTLSLFHRTSATFLFVVPEILIIIQQCELPKFNDLNGIMIIFSKSLCRKYTTMYLGKGTLCQQFTLSRFRGKSSFNSFCKLSIRLKIVSNCFLNGFTCNKNVIQLGTNVAKGIKAFVSRQ